MKALSERLKEAMNRINITQAELVKRTGITKGALSSYINGRYEPKQKAIYKLAKALNVNEAWLMGYDVPMERKSLNKQSQFGDDEANRKYLADKPELLEIYNQIVNRDDMVILFDKTKDLEPKDVESVLMFVQTIRKQRGLDD